MISVGPEAHVRVCRIVSASVSRNWWKPLGSIAQEICVLGLAALAGRMASASECAAARVFCARARPRLTVAPPALPDTRLRHRGGRPSCGDQRTEGIRATSRLRSNSGRAAQGTKPYSASRYDLTKAAIASGPLCGSRSPKTKVYPSCAETATVAGRLQTPRHWTIRTTTSGTRSCNTGVCAASITSPIRGTSLEEATRQVAHTLTIAENPGFTAQRCLGLSYSDTGNVPWLASGARS